MGIINTTPDSFYEGSRKNSAQTILNKVTQFVNEGVDIIDIGGYSSRPGAKHITEEEEIERIATSIQTIRQKHTSILISIDTFRSNVAKVALENGANIINDISGGQADSKIFSIAAEFSAPYIMMHMRGTPQNMQNNTTYDSLVKDLLFYFSKQIKTAKKHGVKDIIIDPGLGFSKTLDQNYEIVSKIDLLKTLEVPVLIGASRKSMLYKLLDITANESLNATTIINTIALQNEANILRVHDVKEAVEARIISTKIKTFNL